MTFYSFTLFVQKNTYLTGASMFTAEADGFFLRNAAIRSKIFRGAFWHASAYYCRVAFRGWGYPSDWFSFVGFRLARGL